MNRGFISRHLADLQRSGLSDNTLRLGAMVDLARELDGASLAFAGESGGSPQHYTPGIMACNFGRNGEGRG